MTAAIRPDLNGVVPCDMAVVAHHIHMCVCVLVMVLLFLLLLVHGVQDHRLVVCRLGAVRPIAGKG